MVLYVGDCVCICAGVVPHNNDSIQTLTLLGSGSILYHPTSLFLNTGLFNQEYLLHPLVHLQRYDRLVHLQHYDSHHCCWHFIVLHLLPYFM
jgi:hypothetical protein